MLTWDDWFARTETVTDDFMADGQEQRDDTEHGDQRHGRSRN